MPPVAALVAFATLSIILVPIPGPSVMFVISRALSLGRRAALLTVVGNAGGLFLQVLLVAVGLGAVVERSVAAFTVVKLVGAGYLVWLGVQAVRHRRELAQVLDAAGIRAPGGAFGKACASQCPASLSQPRLCKTHAWGGLGRSKRQGGKNAEVIRAESHYNTNTVESRGLGGLGCVGGF